MGEKDRVRKYRVVVWQKEPSGKWRNEFPEILAYDAADAITQAERRWGKAAWAQTSYADWVEPVEETKSQECNCETCEKLKSRFVTGNLKSYYSAAAEPMKTADEGAAHDQVVTLAKENLDWMLEHLAPCERNATKIGRAQLLLELAKEAREVYRSRVGNVQAELFVKWLKERGW
jgi:hypothetical protein